MSTLRPINAAQRQMNNNNGRQNHNNPPMQRGGNRNINNTPAMPPQQMYAAPMYPYMNPQYMQQQQQRGMLYQPPPPPQYQQQMYPQQMQPAPPPPMMQPPQHQQQQQYLSTDAQPFDFDAPKVIHTNRKITLTQAFTELSMRVTVMEGKLQGMLDRPKDLDLNSDSTVSTLLSTIVSRLDKLDKNVPSNVSNLLLDMQREMEYVKQIVQLIQPNAEVSLNQEELIDGSNKKEEDIEYIDVDNDSHHIDPSNNGGGFMSFTR